MIAPSFWSSLPQLVLAVGVLIGSIGSCVAAVFGALNHSQNQIMHEQNEKVIAQTDGINQLKEVLIGKLQTQVETQTVEAAHQKEVTGKDIEIALLKKGGNDGKETQ